MWRPLDVMLAAVGALCGSGGAILLADWATTNNDRYGGTNSPVGWILLLLFAVACGFAIYYRERLKIKETNRQNTSKPE